MTWRLFWILFALGWALFAFLAATNNQMVTPVSPGGILDHQVAGTAARVDEIQGAWSEAGAIPFARFSIGVDLLFIGVLAVAGAIGGALTARAAWGPLLRGLGWLTAFAFLVFGAADYTETIAQFVQAMSHGDDGLAGLAATANKPKVAAFLAGHAGLIACLVGARLTRDKTA
jgi:hypothetical protein